MKKTNKEIREYIEMVGDGANGLLLQEVCNLALLNDNNDIMQWINENCKQDYLPLSGTNKCLFKEDRKKLYIEYLDEIDDLIKSFNYPTQGYDNAVIFALHYNLNILKEQIEEHFNKTSVYEAISELIKKSKDRLYTHICNDLLNEYTDNDILNEDIDGQIIEDINNIIDYGLSSGAVSYLIPSYNCQKLYFKYYNEFNERINILLDEGIIEPIINFDMDNLVYTAYESVVCDIKRELEYEYNIQF